QPVHILPPHSCVRARSSPVNGEIPQRPAGNSRPRFGWIHSTDPRSSRSLAFISKRRRSLTRNSCTNRPRSNRNPSSQPAWNSHSSRCVITVTLRQSSTRGRRRRSARRTTSRSLSHEFARLPTSNRQRNQTYEPLLTGANNRVMTPALHRRLAHLGIAVVALLPMNLAAADNTSPVDGYHMFVGMDVELPFEGELHPMRRLVNRNRDAEIVVDGTPHHVSINRSETMRLKRGLKVGRARAHIGEL